MSTDQKLTLDDPMTAETLGQFQQFAQSRATLAEQFFDLETEKVRIMVAIGQLDKEKTRLFEKELLDRGLTPTTPVEVDASTGKITLLKPPAVPAPTAG
jgi:hypothetical protein